MNKLSSQEFKERKREKLLDYKVYEYNFDRPLMGFEIVRETLAQPTEILEATDPYALMGATNQRAVYALTLLTTSYSAGADIKELAAIYPATLEYWEAFAFYSKRFKEADPVNPSTVAHIPLLGSEFVYANRLICLAILLGHGELVPRIAPIIDYNNPAHDGMLERMLAFYVRDRGQPPSECTKHLPYFKTLKIFDADASLRPALMKEYLEDWYEASRREPYANSHKKGNSFHGYWAWEAAAITYLLAIDDSSYRDEKFYPADLVSFAREINASHDMKSPKLESDLRAKSGDICPKSGVWESLDIPPKQLAFTEGKTMESEFAAYGVTVWRYIGP